MSYKHLEKFKWVIGLKSFDKVCDNIPTLLKTISHPNSEFKNTFSDFIQLLDLFYAEFGLDKLDEFIESYKIVKGTLEKYVQYYPNFSKGYVKKFKKTVIYGLSKINENLIKLFDYKNLFQIKISEEVIRRFILDKDVGFGIKYHFNSNGFVDELNSFTENELQAVYRLLQNPSIERKPRGWIVMGSGQALVRIMMRQRWFKMYVYYLFKANQHKKYTDVLDDRKLPKFEDFEEFTR